MLPLIIALSWLPPSHGLSQGSSALDRARLALGLTSAQALWPETILEGHATYRSTPCGYMLRFAAGGEFAENISGRLGEQFGFDGKAYWQVDSSGAPRRLWYEDVDRLLAIQMILTDGWAKAGSGFKPLIASSGSGDYTVYLTLNGSDLQETLHLDPKTWLPVKAEVDLPDGPLSIVVSGWKRLGEIQLPMRAEITQNNHTDTFVVDSGREAKGRDSFAAPTWFDMNAGYNPKLSSKIESKKAISGHILVHPLVNGQDVGWFILDSCADSMCIDTKAANGLGLKKLGEEPCVGVGGAVMAPFRLADTFKLGPGTVKNMSFVELDIGEVGRQLGVKLAGIVGYDYFKRFIVTLDPAGPEVNVFEPTSYVLPPNGVWSEMRFCTANPAIEASFDGGVGWFTLDTGSDGSVTFHTPYVLRQHLLAGRDVETVQLGGVGGGSEAKAGYLEWFQLGPHRFMHPAVTFATSKIGAFANTYLAGNIGEQFLKPFTTVFDFAGYRVSFVKK